jgi:Ca2+-binding RTX toxin-like protein
MAKPPKVKVIKGNPKDNNLVGTELSDEIRGLGGNDTLSGLGGNDLLDGGDGTDRASYQGDPAGIVVTFTGATSATVQDGYGNTDTLTSIEEVFGSQFADTFNGSDGARNVFIGLQGDDTFNGNGGDDGNPDTVDYSFDVLFGATHGVIVNQSGTEVQGGLTPDTAIDSFGNTDHLPNVRNVIGTQFADQLYGGGHANRIEAGGGNDYVFGFLGNDRLIGQGGDDTVEGGEGNDLVTGGPGSDTFVLDAPSGTSADIITDFVKGEDLLAFHALDYGLPTGTLDPARFETGPSATTNSAEFFYNADEQSLYWDADGVAGESVLVASFETAVPLQSTDILII